MDFPVGGGKVRLGRWKMVEVKTITTRDFVCLFSKDDWFILF